MTEKHHCTIENAPRFWDWIQNRGGIAVWRSINLSNPGASWSTPADRQDKPTWEAGSVPERIVTDPDQVLVSVDREVKRFHVAVRPGSQGLTLKVTDGGSRRIRREVEKAGEGAYHVFDYGDHDNAVIMAPEKTMTLREWFHEGLQEDGGEGGQDPGPEGAAG
jgi:ribosomal protein S6